MVLLKKTTNYKITLNYLIRRDKRQIPISRLFELCYGFTVFSFDTKMAP